MGSIRDRVAEAAARKQPCSLANVLNGLSPDDAVDYRWLIWSADPREIPATVISADLQAHGFTVSAEMVTKHRRGECVGCSSDPK